MAIKLPKKPSAMGATEGKKLSDLLAEPGNAKLKFLEPGGGHGAVSGKWTSIGPDMQHVPKPGSDGSEKSAIFAAMYGQASIGFSDTDYASVEKKVLASVVSKMAEKSWPHIHVTNLSSFLTDKVKLSFPSLVSILVSGYDIEPDGPVLTVQYGSHPKITLLDASNLPDAIALMYSADLPEKLLQKCQKSVSEAFVKLVELGAPPAFVTFDNAQVSSENTVENTLQGEQTMPSALDLLKAGKGPSQSLASKVQSETPVGEFGIYPVDKMTTGERIKLSTARLLYQPVEASSAGSRYFVVAASDTLAVACRYQSGQLSTRIEGSLLSDEGFRKTLKNIGFDNISASYASVHVSCDKALAAKALGALVMALSHEFKTPMPVASLVIGA